MTLSMRELLVLLLATALGSGTLLGVAGYAAGRHSHQNVSELQSVGFRVIDPEGYEVNRFDDGWRTLFSGYKGGSDE
jgi:hypothetical protein